MRREFTPGTEVPLVQGTFGHAGERVKRELRSILRGGPKHLERRHAWLSFVQARREEERILVADAPKPLWRRSERSIRPRSTCFIPATGAVWANASLAPKGSARSDDVAGARYFGPH